MQRIGLILITILSSIVVVPVVFFLLAVANWNIAVPLIRVVSTENCDSLEVFIWHMLSPVRNSIKTVRVIYVQVGDAMLGRETFHIVSD